jgi:hypothetical protein
MLVVVLRCLQPCGRPTDTTTFEYTRQRFGTIKRHHEGVAAAESLWATPRFLAACSIPLDRM